MLVLAFTFVAFSLLGMPVAFALGLSAAMTLLWLDMPLHLAPSRFMAGIDSFVLLAAPFFILVGELLNRGGITDRIVLLSRLMVGRFTGGTAYSNVISSVMFAGLSGSAAADVAALGRIFIRGMPQEGYRREYAAGLTVGSSILSPIIPPSVIMVIYASVAQVSVIDLFIAGLLPGIALAAAIALVIFYDGWRGRLPAAVRMETTVGLLRLVRDGVAILSIPFFIRFGTTGGVFTATEAGGLAVIYAGLLSLLLFSRMSLKDIWAALVSSARLSATIYMIIGSASIVSYILTVEGLGDFVRQLALPLADEPVLFLVVVMIAMLLVGTILDPAAAIALLVPVLAPVALVLGIDPLHFAMVVIVSLTLGLVTPPVGICLYVGCSIAQLSVGTVARAVLPFFVAALCVLIVMIFFPPIATFLPRL